MNWSLIVRSRRKRYTAWRCLSGSELRFDDVCGFFRNSIDSSHGSGTDLKRNDTGVDDTKVLRAVNLKAGINDTADLLGGKRGRSDWVEHGRDIALHPAANGMSTRRNHQAGINKRKSSLSTEQRRTLRAVRQFGRLVQELHRLQLSRPEAPSS